MLRSLRNPCVCFSLTLLLLSVGCQKCTNKKSSRLCCLYDQAEITEACLRAIKEETPSFKRDPFYALFYQGHAYEEGLEALAHIEKKFPGYIHLFDQFRQSDRYGQPHVYDYGTYGHFSPTTLHHIYKAAEICEKMTPSRTARILQIGGGYGGLCKILHDMQAWQTYTIIDLPCHLALARKTLENQGITGVYFLTPEEIDAVADYDLVISDLSFSEYAHSLQQLFIERLLPRARGGFFFCHAVPRHFGVETFSPEQLKKLLKKNLPLSHLEMSDATKERVSYTLIWY